MQEPVLLDIDGGIATVTLNRPKALNTYTPELTTLLLDIVTRLRDDLEVRCVLFTGAGAAFCAGYDLKGLLPNLTADGLNEAGQVAVRQLHDCVREIHALPMPVIAAVNGACAGGGLGLALAADITWAAESAHFRTAFAAIALTPDTGTSYLLGRAIGERKARELLFTNQRVKATESLALGLVTRVLPDSELLAECQKLAQQLAAGPTDALARTKALLDTSVRQSFSEQLDAEVDSALERLASPDLAEGVRAFLEKRPPRFTERTL